MAINVATTNWTSPTPVNYFQLVGGLCNQAQHIALRQLYRHCWFNWIKIDFEFSVTMIEGLNQANETFEITNAKTAGAIVEVCENYALDGFFAANSGVVAVSNDILPWKTMKPDANGTYRYSVKWFNPFKGDTRYMRSDTMSANNLFGFSTDAYKAFWAEAVANTWGQQDPQKALEALFGISAKHLMRLPCFRYKLGGNSNPADGVNAQFQATTLFRAAVKSSITYKNFVVTQGREEDENNIVSDE